MPRKSPDWSHIELQYRAGVPSIREIARQHGVSEGAVRARANRAEPPWDRSLAERVRIVADQKRIHDIAGDQARTKTTAEVVESAATAIFQVVKGHRRVLGMAMQDAELALAMVHEQIAHGETLVLAVEQMTEEPPAGSESAAERRQRLRHRDKLMAVIGLGEGIERLATLSSTIRTLTMAERVAWGVDRADAQKTGVDALVEHFQKAQVFQPVLPPPRTLIGPP